jgi:hypothetical protein
MNQKKIVFYLKADMGQHVRIKTEKSLCFAHLNKRWKEIGALRKAARNPRSKVPVTSTYVRIYLTKEEYDFIRHEHLKGVNINNSFELSMDSTYNVVIRYYLPHVKAPEIKENVILKL